MTTHIDLSLTDEQISLFIVEYSIHSNFSNSCAIVNKLAVGQKFNSALLLLELCSSKNLTFIKNHIFSLCAKDEYSSLEFFISQSPFRKDYEYDVAFLWACDSNSTHCCKVLLTTIDHDGIAMKNGFISAVEKGHTDIINIFLNEIGFDASYNYNFAIKYAIENNFKDLYQKLINNPCVLACSFKNNQGIHSSFMLKDTLKKFPELFL